jgi:hypothetical protein
MDGVVLLASIGERYLGDPAMPRSPGALVEFVFDTTRAVTNLAAR